MSTEDWEAIDAHVDRHCDQIVALVEEAEILGGAVEKLEDDVEKILHLLSRIFDERDNALKQWVKDYTAEAEDRTTKSLFSHVNETFSILQSLEPQNVEGGLHPQAQ